MRCFSELIVGGRHTTFFPIDRDVASRAAELRAQYNLTLTDAFQVAECIVAGCDAFLTNDLSLTRVREVDALVLDAV